MYSRIKEFVGNLWGATTTQGLALLVLIQPVLLEVDPQVLSDWPWLHRVIFGVSIATVMLRYLAPPPPSVVIRRDDTVFVDKRDQTVTIIKAEPIKNTVVAKAAGEKT